MLLQEQRTNEANGSCPVREIHTTARRRLISTSRRSGRVVVQVFRPCSGGQAPLGSRRTASQPPAVASHASHARRTPGPSAHPRPACQTNGAWMFGCRTPVGRDDCRMSSAQASGRRMDQDCRNHLPRNVRHKPTATNPAPSPDHALLADHAARRPGRLTRIPCASAHGRTQTRPRTTRGHEPNGTVTPWGPRAVGNPDGGADLALIVSRATRTGARAAVQNTTCAAPREHHKASHRRRRSTAMDGHPPIQAVACAYSRVPRSPSNGLPSTRTVTSPARPVRTPTTSAPVTNPPDGAFARNHSVATA